MRRSVSLFAALCVVLALGPAGSSTAAPEPNWSKLSPSMAELVARGGYGEFPIDLVVRNYQPGTVFYLAGVSGSIDQALVQALAGTGAKVRFRFPEIGYVALVSPVAAVAAVSQLPRVQRLEIDRVHDVQAITTQVAQFGDQTKRGTSDIGAPALWAAGITGSRVTVGVTDSGIDSTHPDIGYKLRGFVDCTAVVPSVITDVEDVGTCTPTPGYDDNGHGTHVSGIAAGGARGGLPTQAGLYPGVAPAASLVGAKVCLAAGSCLNSSVMAGLRYLATETGEGGLGADVVNVSLGSGRFYFAPLFGAEQVTNNDPEAQLVNELATRYNVVFTISAGNSGPVLQSLGSPSVASQVISVGAAITDWDLNHPVEQTAHGEFGNIRPEASAAGATGIASFSSRGPTGDRLIKPELTAPGVYYIAAESAEGAEIRAADITHRHNFSADPFYAVLSGTSMSAPAAAGASALVWDGYEALTGQDPAYYRVKAALANTAGTHAFEGPVVGLISGIRAKNLGEDPADLFPLRNEAWVGVSGEGPGRINAPAAYLAITKGVLVYTPQIGELDDIHELQPHWSIGDVGRGQSLAQTFLLHGAPAMQSRASVRFGVDTGKEPVGVKPAPRAWFRLPNSVSVTQNADKPFQLKLNVPANAAPGMYGATVTGTARLTNKVTQNVRIPVQFFVELAERDSAEGSGTSIEGPIWASEPTDYSIVGFEDPLGDIFTDWVSYPIRIPAGTQRVDLSVYDVAGTDHMDVFVFDQNGQEIDSTVTPFLDHAVPGGALYAPTTAADPNTVSLLDGDDLIDVVLPTTVWVEISDSQPQGVGFSTHHLDADLVGGGTGGTTPPERIHSGQHAWWSGSVGDADGHLTKSFALPANASELSFWTWYNLEDGFDWAYALVSTDGGSTWTSLVTTAANGSGTTTLDPIGDSGGVLGGSKAYPNGLTGRSGAPALSNAGLLTNPVMTQHTADIGAYAGQTVQIRFAYTSDPATNLENFYVDDVAVSDGSGNVLSSDDMETNATWQPGGSPGFAWVTAEAA